MSAAADAGVVHEYDGIRYVLHPDVYEPADDTWLLVEALRAEPELLGRRVVEVGCGAGLALLAAVRAGARGLGVDRNPAALGLLVANARRNGFADRVAAVRGDLVGAVDPAGVDLVLFNPPYLPTAAEERFAGELSHAFDGGLSGNETILRFVDGLAEWRAGGARLPPLLLVTSSLNDRVAIHAQLARLGYGAPAARGERGFPFERLHVERFAPEAAPKAFSGGRAWPPRDSRGGARGA